MIPLFVPPLVAGVAWSILGSPKSGLLNTLLPWAGLDWRIDLYSMAGLILVFGMYYAPYVYMFTASALRNMDPSLEEAAEIAGVGPVRTLFTITFPLIAPAIISGMLLSFIVMLGIYGIPAVLGAPGQYLGAHHLHFQADQLEPAALQHRRRGRDHPDGSDRRAGAAPADACWRARSFIDGRRQGVPAARARCSGRGAGSRSASRSLYLFVVVVLPTLALIVAAFRRFLFIPDAASLFDPRQYSLMHFERLFDNPLTHALDLEHDGGRPHHRARSEARSRLRSATRCTAAPRPAAARST